MKNLFLALLVALTFMSCEKEEILIDTSTEATILGRWVAEGFESNIRYEFTEDRRFSIYGTDGVVIAHFVRYILFLFVVIFILRPNFIGGKRVF